MIGDEAGVEVYLLAPWRMIELELLRTGQWQRKGKTSSSEADDGLHHAFRLAVAATEALYRIPMRSLGGGEGVR